MDPLFPQDPNQQQPGAQGAASSPGQTQANTDDLDDQPVTLISVPVPQPPGRVDDIAPSPAIPVLSPGDAALLSVVGRFVAVFVVLLGIASALLCLYAAYRAVLWLWFTP